VQEVIKISYKIVQEGPAAFEVNGLFGLPSLRGSSVLVANSERLEAASETFLRCFVVSNSSLRRLFSSSILFNSLSDMFFSSICESITTLANPIYTQ